MTKCNQAQSILQKGTNCDAKGHLSACKRIHIATQKDTFCKMDGHVLKNVYCFEANQNHAIFAENKLHSAIYK